MYLELAALNATIPTSPTRLDRQCSAHAVCTLRLHPSTVCCYGSAGHSQAQAADTVGDRQCTILYRTCGTTAQVHDRVCYSLAHSLQTVPRASVLAVSNPGHATQREISNTMIGAVDKVLAKQPCPRHQPFPCPRSRQSPGKAGARQLAHTQVPVATSCRRWKHTQVPRLGCTNAHSVSKVTVPPKPQRAGCHSALELALTRRHSNELAAKPACLQRSSLQRLASIIIHHDRSRGTGGAPRGRAAAPCCAAPFAVLDDSQAACCPGLHELLALYTCSTASSAHAAPCSAAPLATLVVAGCLPPGSLRAAGAVLVSTAHVFMHMC